MNSEAPKAADILIIDDSPADTALMEEAIKNTMVSNSIHVVHQAAEAVKFLNKKEDYKDAPRPDLILLDLKMPDFNGHELLGVIKKDPRFEHIPVIVLTGSNNPADIEKSYKLGANCCVLKPGNFMKFKKVVGVINDFWFGIARLPPKETV